MKNIILLATLMLAFTFGYAQNDTYKRYEVASGVVKYKMTIDGKVLGSTTVGSGTSSTYFKNWGRLERREEKSTKTITTKFFGKQDVKTTKTHTMQKLANGKSYNVNFEDEYITVITDPAVAYIKQKGVTATKAGKDMLEMAGGKMIGYKTYKGYKCEEWSIMGGTQLMYKGVVLKIDMKLLGTRIITEATDVKFNIPVADANFKIPNFPIRQNDTGEIGSFSDQDKNDMNNMMDKIDNMSYEEWKKMATKNDEEMGEMSEEELRETYDMIQKVLKSRKK